MNWYLSAVKLNNRGVQAFESGNLHDAVDLFRQAIESLNTDQAIPTSDDDESATSRGQQSEDDMAVVAALSGIERDMYDHALLRTMPLDTRALAYSKDPLVSLSVASTIVIFNLAMVYHKHGLSSALGETPQAATLLKAHSFYSKSQSLLCRLSGSDVSRSAQMLINLLVMAILNNYGQMAFLLSDFETSRMHFERLVAYAASLPLLASGDPRQADAENIKVAFLRNVVSLTPPSTAAAA